MSYFLYVSCTFLNPFLAHVQNPGSLLPGLKLALPQIGLKPDKDGLKLKNLTYQTKCQSCLIQ